MVEDCLEAGRCVNKWWSHHPQVIWEAFEQYITCKVPPNSPVKLPWFGVKAMIDDEHGRGIFYGSMILKCLGDPPSHVMPGSSKFCLGSSMARHVSGSRGWRPRYVVESLSDVSMESWFWMNFESPKTHQPHQPHHNHLDLDKFQVISFPDSLQKWRKKPQQKHPPVRWPGSSCGAATIVAGQGPYWLRWLLYWGVSFFFLVCGLKNPKEAAIEQLGELEKLDRCTED